jgi:hypothetical protein
MIVAYMIAVVALCFIGGMHYALWDNFGERKSLYFSMGMVLLGVINLISLIGHVSKHTT